LKLSGPDNRVEQGSCSLDVPMVVVVETAGDYTLDVRAASPSDRGASYELVLQEVRPALEPDRTSAAAWKLVQQARSSPGAREQVRLLEQAVSLYRAAGDALGEADAVDRLGSAYNVAREVTQAQEAWTRAVDLWGALANRPREAYALHALGTASGALGELQPMLEQYTRALAIWREVGDRRGEATALTFLGGGYRRLGEYPQALDLVREALQVDSEEGKRPRAPLLLRLMGELYEKLGDRQKAVAHYGEAAEEARTGGDADNEGWALAAAGKLYFDAGEYHRSLEVLTEAARVWDAPPRTGRADFGCATVFCQMAAAHAALGEREKALAYLERALSGNEARRSPEAILRDAAPTYSKLGESRRALDLLNQAVPSLRPRYPSETAATLALIALVERDAGQLADARRHIEEALQTHESIRTAIAAPEARTSYFATYQDYYRFYVDLLMRMHVQHPREGFAAAALQASERARGRSLLETLGRARGEIRQGGDPALLERRRSLERRLNAEALQRPERGGGSAAREDAAAAAMRRLTAEYERLEAQILAQNARYAALARPAPLSLEEIQDQVLDGDTLLLEYSLGERHSYLWVVAPHAFAPFELAPGAEIDAAARRFHEMLAARAPRAENETAQGRRARLWRSQAQLAEAAALLGRMVLEPAAGWLRAKRLLVVADGALQYVPFAALPDPNRSGQPLVAAHEIVTIPSASVLAISRKERSARQPAPGTVSVVPPHPETPFDRTSSDRPMLPGSGTAGTTFPDWPSRAAKPRRLPRRRRTGPP
jgi:tetratricopeptide (TPR) repeat protein